MRLHGAAILAQLRDEQHLEVLLVQNTQDALTEIDHDASVATVLVGVG